MNSKIKRKILFSIIILLLTVYFISCSSENKKIINFQNNEIARIKNNINSILNHLSYTNYHMFIIPHSAFHIALQNQTYKSEYFSGKGFVPEGVPGVDPNYPPGYHNENKSKDSLYYNKQFTQTYNDKKKNNKQKYHFEHINVLIIFNEISDKDIKKLNWLIKGTVLNKKRDDEIIILSKPMLKKTKK